jgi:hypothetical protein
MRHAKIMSRLARGFSNIHVGSKDQIFCHASSPSQGFGLGNLVGYSVFRGLCILSLASGVAPR